MPSKNEIRTARELLQESQVQFAKRFGVNQATISRWECYGVPTYGMAHFVVKNFLEDLKSTAPTEPTAAGAAE